MPVNVKKMKEKYAKRKKEREQYTKGGINYWKPEEGTNLIRILPPKGDNGDFAHEVPYHYNVNKSAYVCLKYVKKNCPICEDVDELYKTRSSSDTKIANSMRAKPRYISNIIEPQNDPKKVKVFFYGSMIHDDLLSYFADDDYGDITDVKDGYDVKIIREGEGLETKYRVRLVKNSSELEYAKKVLNSLIDVETQIIEKDIKDYDELRAILDGLEPGEGKDEEDEDDDDDDDDDDADEDEKDGDDKDDEDEDDDDDDDSKEKSNEDDEDDDDDDDDKKESSEDEDEDDEDDDENADEDDEDEDDDDEKKSKTKSSKAASVIERLRKMKSKTSKPTSKSSSKKKKKKKK